MRRLTPALLRADPRTRPFLVGLLVAAFLVAGRWDLARISTNELSQLAEPRWFIALATAIVVWPRRPRARAWSEWTAEVRRVTNTASPVILFLGFMVLSSLWAPPTAPTATKALELALLAAMVWLVEGTVRTGHSASLATGVVTGLTMLCGALALGAFVLGIEDGGSARVAVLGGGPNVFGRNMAVLAVVSLWGFLSSGRSKAAWLTAGTVASSLLLLSGSRGAFAAAGVACAWVIYVRRSRVTNTIFAAAVGLFVIPVALSTSGYGEAVAQTYQARIQGLLIEDVYLSGRDLLYAEALACGAESPLVGKGLGAFATRVTQAYPHNVTLEAYCEGGATGVALWALIVLRFGRRVWRERREAPALLAAIGLLMLAAAQVSGDLYDARGFFLAAAALAVTGHESGASSREGPTRRAGASDVQR